MLIDIEGLVSRGALTGVLHVGAHFAEEAPVYDRYDVPVLWVEGNFDLIMPIWRVIQAYPKQSVVQGLVYDVPDVEIPFNITNFDSMSSSVFEFGTHTEFSPEIVVVERRMTKTTTIDRLLSLYDDVPVNMLAMDIQGAELLALRGAEGLIPRLDFVYCEVNATDVYQGCAHVEDIDDFLRRRGLQRSVTTWQGDQGWGDALYRRDGG